MSYFTAKMHQIRFRLGLRPRPRWGSLQRSPPPVPLAGFRGAYFWEEGGWEGKGRGQACGGGGRGGGGREVEGKEGEGSTATSFFTL